MSPLGPAAGLWMLVSLAALTLTTGLPVWSLLIGVASAFAAAGLASGAIDLPVLSALPPRLVGLLEHDLLQALPLYVFVGVLLQRLAVADALWRALAHALRRTGAGPALATLGTGALVAPMNGSVASTSALLSRLLGPRLAQLGAERATVLGAVAATIGVVVPPSLVLILLGDAMLRAHTEASNLPGFQLGAQRIVNTQDVFHAALLPACAVLALWAAIAVWQARRPMRDGRPLPESGPKREPSTRTVMPSAAEAPPSAREAGVALACMGVLVALLAGVFTGWLLAVEAAATAGCIMACGALVHGRWSRSVWAQVLADTLAQSGALIALLVGATVFSLVLRLFGTDRLLAETLLASPLPPWAGAALTLVLVGLCAWVLDAFEMIFVVIPIVAPPLIAMLLDAQQVAVLLLLVLQASFLLPPMGYAILMARSRSPVALPLRTLMPVLAPYLLAQFAVMAAVFCVPAALHLLDEPAQAASEAAPAAGAPAAAGSAAPGSADEIEQRMREMSANDGTATDAGSVDPAADAASATAAPSASASGR
jgi:TRAP-type mannitol/chloroaromatic compound transport system permease large subunit